MRTRSFLSRAGLPAALVAAAGLAHGQTTYETIAFESFDYAAGSNLGDQNGGSGWVTGWYSGGGGDDAQIFVPGFDAIGGLARDVKEDGGSYRRIDLTGWDSITDDIFGAASGPLLGKDDTTIWITYQSQIIPGGDDNYGGLSCFIFLDPNQIGEYLFIGVPFQNGAWGLDWPNGIGGVVAPFGPQTLTKLVTRIDFQAGMERVRLWINPAVDKPTTTPDLDQMVPDFRFNEMRIESGSGGTSGAVAHGWDFDEIRIECENCSPTQPLTGLPTTLSLGAGGQQNLDINAGPAFANDLYLLVGSASGTSPGFPIDANLTLPLNIDNYTIATLNKPNLPPLINSFSNLDANGQAQAGFFVVAGTNPAYAGITLDHAAIVVSFSGPIPAISFVTNPASVTLTP